MTLSAAITAPSATATPAPANFAGALDSFALPPAASLAPAPLSLQQLALPQNFGALAGIKKAIVSVPIRKPSNQAYVRVRPGDAWRFQCAMLQLKEDGECYLVLPHLYLELANEVRPKIVYTGINRDGSVFMWPINAPGEDGRLDAWSESAHVAAQMAETSWIRLVANRTVGAYDVMEASQLAETPQWPDKSFEELVQIAFKGRVIEHLDHPIVKRLRGEI
jgi:hypothetical protein